MKCEHCGKRIWFWQKSYFVVKSLPVTKKIVHEKCFIESYYK